MEGQKWVVTVSGGTPVLEDMKWGCRRAAERVYWSAKEAAEDYAQGGAEARGDAMCRLLEKAAEYWEMGGCPWRAASCRELVRLWRAAA